MEVCYDRGLGYGGVLRWGVEIWRRATIGIWGMEACFDRGMEYGGVLR